MTPNRHATYTAATVGREIHRFFESSTLIMLMSCGYDQLKISTERSTTYLSPTFAELRIQHLQCLGDLDTDRATAMVIVLGHRDLAVLQPV